MLKVYVLGVVTVSTAALMADVAVMTPKDFENGCQQPIALGTVICMVVMCPLHILGMYGLFIYMDKNFNPHRLMAKQRTRALAKRIAYK